MADTSVPWAPLLHQSHKKNYRSVVFVQMTNLRRNGEPSLHNIRFQDFLKDDPRYLLFLMALNDHNLHGDIKSNPKVELCWQMPTTKEIYNMSGRFYIVSAPLKITRFPPPKILADDTPTTEYWESIRQQVWNAISAQTRAIFTFPPSGEAPRSNKNEFKCQKLDNLVDSNVPLENPDRVIHDLAFDNFCVLVFKVYEVVRFEYGTFPAKRIIYSLDEDEITWTEQETNP